MSGHTKKVDAGVAEKQDEIRREEKRRRRRRRNGQRNIEAERKHKQKTQISITICQKKEEKFAPNTRESVVNS